MTETQKKVINSATLLMGRTHSGKSSLLATAMTHVWETYGKISLLYLSDGGGLPFQVQSLVNLGICWLWRMRSRSGEALTHETCQRAAAGYWPRTIDPETGETPSDVELIPPYQTSITMLCPKGHVVKVVALDTQLRTAAVCPTCNITVNATNMHTTRTTTPTPGFEQVGARMYDGLSSMLNWGMNDLTDRVGRQELTGEKSALGGVVQSGAITLAGSNRAQVGFMQTRAETLVLTSSGVRGMVIPPIWTALTQDGNDEAGLRICGPQIIGQARTAEAPQWFGDTIEVVIVNTNDGKRYRRMNLKSYVDPEGTRHLCGVRSYPGMLPDYLQDEDTGEIGAEAFMDFNLGKYYQLRENARLQTEAMFQEKYQNVPGLPSGTFEVVLPKVEGTAPPPVAKPLPAPAKPKPVPVAAKAVPPALVPTVPAAPPSPPAPAPAPPPSAAVTGPTAAMPPAPKPPARGPSAPPPGRRPIPAAPVARPTAAPPAK